MKVYWASKILLFASTASENGKIPGVLAERDHKSIEGTLTLQQFETIVDYRVSEFQNKFGSLHALLLVDL